MFAESPPKKMNTVISVFFILCFLSLLIVPLSTLPKSRSNLLEELATKHQGKLCLLDSGHSGVELPLSFGSMLVGVWDRPMLGSDRVSYPRATISIESSSDRDLPEFMIHSKYALSCDDVYGFKKASCTDVSIDPQFKQQWCVFVRPEISSQQINTLLRQLNSPLINLRLQASSPQKKVVNISYRGQKIDYVYSDIILGIDSLELLMQASVEFAQALL
jgi:hypothetical protein